MNISVIVPCYNSSAYLADCVQSLAAQTYRNFEAIFIDDGSTDGTFELLERLSAEHSDLRIRIQSQPNRGVSAARNLGLDIAQGEYISFVDSDDIVAPSFLERLVDTIDGVGLAVVGIGGDGYGRQSGEFTGVIRHEDFIRELWFTDHLWGSTCNKLFHRSVIDEYAIRFESDLKIMEDMFFTMVYLQHVDAMRVMNEHLYYYRNRAGSTMHRGFHPDTLTVIETFERMLSLPLSEPDRQIIKLHQVNGLMWAMRVLYQSGTREDVAKYEPVLRQSLATSDRALFARQGWRKGWQRYGAFVLYSIHPKLLRMSLHFFTALKVTFQRRSTL